MTIADQSVSQTTLDPAPMLPLERRGNRRLPAIALLIITILYLLLQNPYWVRYGDSELYLSMARSIARGEGYVYNGQHVSIVTPAWPYILAGAMKISPSLSFLKLLPMFCMLGFFTLAAALLLEITTPMLTACCLVTAALLQPVFYLSYMFFSDGLFAFVGLLAAWLGLRIARGRDSWLSIVVLCLLCALNMMVRWAALPWFVVIGAAVLDGEFLPRFNRKWIAFTLAATTTVGVFFAMRAILRVDPSQIDPRYDTLVSGGYDLFNSNQDYASYSQRLGSFGQWIGGLLWKPGQTFRAFRDGDNAIGWILSLLIFIFAIIPAIKQRRWIWVGAAAYVVMLGIDWPTPVVRYIVPLAPFIVFAAYSSIVRMTGYLPATWTWARPLALRTLMASILLINFGTYLSEAIPMRSRNFYSHYEGGVHEQLIAAAEYLNHQPRGDGEIAISQRMVNFNRQAYTGGFFRALNFLADRNIMSVPRDLSREPDASLIGWSSLHNVRYYLYQPPFRLIGNMRMHSPPLEEVAWRLYEIRDGRAQRIILSPPGDWPLKVPGM